MFKWMSKNKEEEMNYDPNLNMVGGFSDNDGTIDFYLRVNSLISKDQIVLDFGAGRASWFEEDKCETKREIRMLKGKVKKVIACDLDKAVLENRASDEQHYMKEGNLDIEENSIDLIVSDYVLEHIEDPKEFVKQAEACLKSGGWFCARTPHKFSYVSIAASLIKNILHSKVLSRAQPDRKEIDIFPTRFRMNTMRDINNAFDGWNNKSFIFRSDPDYYFGSKVFYKLQSIVHRIMPKIISGNLFIFVQKP